MFQSTLKSKKNKNVLSPMNEEDIQDIVQKEARSAVNFVDSQLSGLRVKVDKYYQGQTAIPTIVGRSKIVITKVRDVVHSVIPSVARIFTQAPNIAEFSSEDEGDDKIVKDQTLFVNSIYNKFGGYQALIQASTDALKARIGVIQVTLNKSSVPVAMPPQFLPPEQISSINDAHDADETQPQVTEMGPPHVTEDGTTLHESILTHYTPRTMWYLDIVPPECFIVNSLATSLQDFRVIGTRQNLRIYDAVEKLGLEAEELMEIGINSVDQTSQMDLEKQQRTTYFTLNQDEGTTNPEDPTAGMILICNLWIRLDCDGDGKAELRNVITAGSNYKVVYNEPTSHVPLAIFKTDLQPHVFFPISLAEDMMPDQDAATSLTRSILDNTALVNSPRTEINESMVNLEDAKNNEIGAIVRVKQMGQINELATPFVAGQTLPVLQYLNDVSETKSGVTKLSQGLDPNAIQSTSTAAVKPMVQGADARIEMMARNLGETGVRDLFLAILRTAMEELKGPQSVQTDSGYQDVQPDTWHDQIQVNINVGLGNGRIDEKLAALGAVSQVQHAFVDKLGFQNPICGWNELRTTYKQMLRLAGLKQVSDFFPPVTPQVLQQLDQAAAKQAAQAAQAQVPQAPDVKGAAQIKGQVDMQINSSKLAQEFQLKTREKNQEAAIASAQLKQKQEGEITRLTTEQRLQLQLALLEDDRLRDKQQQDYEVEAYKVSMDSETKKEVANAVAETRTPSNEGGRLN